MRVGPLWRWGVAAAAAWGVALADGGTSASARPSGADGGTTVAAAAIAPSAALSDEDREVVENLELLQSLDAATDLDLLLELSQGADEAD